jgi:hypothetical protein
MSRWLPATPLVTQTTEDTTRLDTTERRVCVRPRRRHGCHSGKLRPAQPPGSTRPFRLDRGACPCLALVRQMHTHTHTHTHTQGLLFLHASRSSLATTTTTHTQVVGTGTYGEVYKARHKRTGELTAIKVLDLIEVPYSHTPTPCTKFFAALALCPIDSPQ